MNIETWLANAQAELSAHGISSARLDCLLLLEHVLQQDRAWVLAHLDAKPSAEQLQQLQSLVERRNTHEPMAYIRGFCEFYGRRFIVNSDVLVPRPESESMIELLKQSVIPKAVIADIGTGSGCLAVSAKLETGAVVIAVDIDKACLNVAQQNAAVHTASVRFIEGSLLEPFTYGGSASGIAPTVLLANLPYVPNEYPINKAAEHEPTVALFAGSDGLDAYRLLFQQTTQLSVLPQIIITEALLSQHALLEELAATHGYSLVITDGLAQLFRPL